MLLFAGEKAVGRLPTPPGPQFPAKESRKHRECAELREPTFVAVLLLLLLLAAARCCWRQRRSWLPENFVLDCCRVLIVERQHLQGPGSRTYGPLSVPTTTANAEADESNRTTTTAITTTTTTTTIRAVKLDWRYSRYLSSRTNRYGSIGVA